MEIAIRNPQKEAIAVLFVIKVASTSALLEAQQSPYSMTFAGQNSPDLNPLL